MLLAIYRNKISLYFFLSPWSVTTKHRREPQNTATMKSCEPLMLSILVGCSKPSLCQTSFFESLIQNCATELCFAISNVRWYQETPEVDIWTSTFWDRSQSSQINDFGYATKSSVTIFQHSSVASQWIHSFNGMANLCMMGWLLWKIHSGSWIYMWYRISIHSIC